MSEAQKTSASSLLGGLTLWGRHSLLGLATAFIALILDQAHKSWMIGAYGPQEGPRFTVTSFFDVVMVWNPGISYGLLPQGSTTGRILLMAVSLAAVIALLVWIGNAANRLIAVSLGLIVGGALGNVADRLVYGKVADFFSFHYAGFYWYVFNVADVAITAGVIGLVLDWLMPAGGSDKEAAAG
jgi:signal peptidase II